MKNATKKLFLFVGIVCGLQLSASSQSKDSLVCYTIPEAREILSGIIERNENREQLQSLEVKFRTLEKAYEARQKEAANLRLSLDVCGDIVDNKNAIINEYVEIEELYKMENRRLNRERWALRGVVTLGVVFLVANAF
jgi:chromosome segregation ATPase